jgi:hypothetical protein
MTLGTANSHPARTEINLVDEIRGLRPCLPTSFAVGHLFVCVLRGPKSDLQTR